MDKVIEETFKVFSHLARDIQTYIIAGIILLFDFYIIDKIYYNESFSQTILNSDYVILIIIVGAYILGQICLAFYTLLIELTSLDKHLYKNVFKERFKDNDNATDEDIMADKGKIFTGNKETYLHFVERDVNLSTLRWNYSSAFLICAIVNFIYCICESFEKEILIIGFVSLFLSCILMLLHIFTQKETASQVSKLKTLAVITEKNHISATTTTTTTTTTTPNHSN